MPAASPCARQASYIAAASGVRAKRGFVLNGRAAASCRNSRRGPRPCAGDRRRAARGPGSRSMRASYSVDEAQVQQLSALLAHALAQRAREAAVAQVVLTAAGRPRPAPRSARRRRRTCCSVLRDAESRHHLVELELAVLGDQRERLGQAARRRRRARAAARRRLARCSAAAPDRAASPAGSSFRARSVRCRDRPGTARSSITVRGLPCDSAPIHSATTCRCGASPNTERSKRVRFSPVSGVSSMHVASARNNSNALCLLSLSIVAATTRRPSRASPRARSDHASDHSST